MIEGVVNAAYEAVVRLTVQGPSGHSREIEALDRLAYTWELRTAAVSSFRPVSS